MTVTVMSQKELIAYILKHGWSISSTDYWNDHDIIIFAKNNKTFTFQCEEKYFYIAVYRTCKVLDIPCPDDVIHSYYRHFKMDDEPCYCGKNETLFKECHGKV